jgi:hypothetical protein
MWIAACCLTHGITLATLNLKDYEDFNQHHGLRILGREVAGRFRDRALGGRQAMRTESYGDPAMEELAAARDSDELCRLLVQTQR